MTTAKQKKRNRAYARQVKFDYGSRKAFDAGAVTKQAHEFGILAERAPTRGRMNGRPIF